MNIAEVQLVRKGVLGVGVLVGVLMFAFISSRTGRPQVVHEAIEWTGIAAIIVCILGRTWCTLYIGGRKIEQFVTEGPYSVSRNPLYFFSILGAAGAGAQTGSVTAAVLFGALAWIVFYFVVLQEEQLLAGRYSTAYANYLATVPRFLPNPWRWRDAVTVTVAPSKMIRTFADAMFFLLTVPLAEALEHLQNTGVLPVLLRLP
jgi:protein-S-isoprenylcysteine O-methyltransferase Ste14